MFVDNIIPACHGTLEQGHRVALVTLLHIDGSSPRPQGSQLGVADNGQSVGMITGGCAEKAVIAEALQCLENSENKIVRYGVGSPYLDVVLPCGSGIDLFIETRNSAQLIREVHVRQQQRKPVWMAFDRSALSSRLLDTPESALEMEIVNRYEPDYRLMVFGEGANLISFCALATGERVFDLGIQPRSGIDRRPACGRDRRAPYPSAKRVSLACDRRVHGNHHAVSRTRVGERYSPRSAELGS